MSLGVILRAKTRASLYGHLRKASTVHSFLKHGKKVSNKEEEDCPEREASNAASYLDVAEHVGRGVRVDTGGRAAEGPSPTRELIQSRADDRPRVRGPRNRGQRT